MAHKEIEVAKENSGAYVLSYVSLINIKKCKCRTFLSNGLERSISNVPRFNKMHIRGGELFCSHFWSLEAFLVD